MSQVQETIHHYCSHHVFDVGAPLPKKTIKYFDKSHGIIIKIGYLSHPESVEVESHVPDWAEHLDLFLEKLDSLFGANTFNQDNSKNRITLFR
jgi:hypothetical protein